MAQARERRSVLWPFTRHRVKFSSVLGLWCLYRKRYQLSNKKQMNSSPPTLYPSAWTPAIHMGL